MHPEEPGHDLVHAQGRLLETLSKHQEVEGDGLPSVGTP